jgi:hypothetical protein
VIANSQPQGVGISRGTRRADTATGGLVRSCWVLYYPTNSPPTTLVPRGRPPPPPFPQLFAWPSLPPPQFDSCTTNWNETRETGQLSLLHSKKSPDSSLLQQKEVSKRGSERDIPAYHGPSSRGGISLAPTYISLSLSRLRVVRQPPRASGERAHFLRSRKRN